MSRIAFVTGATGLLGSNLVRQLVAEGWQVRALVRSRQRALTQLGGVPMELVEGDMTRVADFAPRLQGAQVLFHTAACFRNSYKGGSHWEELRRVNVEGTRELLAAAYAAGIRRVVHTSSIGVLAARPGAALVDETMRRDPTREQDDYYRSKVLTDEVVDEALARWPQLHATFILPGFMNGPGDVGPTSAGQIVLDFLQGALPGIIDTHFSYVDVRDVAQALVRAAEHGRRGERYVVAGRTLHLREALALLERVTGVAAPQRLMPTPALAVFALLSEAWARLSGRPVLMSWAGYRTLRREGGSMFFDSSKAQRELGVSFRPLEETFTDAVRWFTEHGMARLDKASLPQGCTVAPARS